MVDGEPCSASLFDFGLFFFHNAAATLAAGQGPYFYLPKMESHLEARWARWGGGGRNVYFTCVSVSMLVHLARIQRIHARGPTAIAHCQSPPLSRSCAPLGPAAPAPPRRQAVERRVQRQPGHAAAAARHCACHGADRDAAGRL